MPYFRRYAHTAWTKSISYKAQENGIFTHCDQFGRLSLDPGKPDINSFADFHPHDSIPFLVATATRLTIQSSAKTKDNKTVLNLYDIQYSVLTINH